MLFFLRKLIEALLLPVGFSMLLVLLAVVLRRRWIAVVAVVILYAFSAPRVGWWLLRPLENVYPPVSASNAPHADAIVVLSGSILRGRNAGGLQWGNSANRFFSGVDLGLAGKAKLFVISSGYFPWEGPMLRSAAINDGVPPAQIVLTPMVYTTEDEARAVSSTSGIHSILLVTSASHMPRAALLFRARGLDVHPFPTDQKAPSSDTPLTWMQFTPDPSGIGNSEAALREYYGLAVYRTILLFRSH